jgi:hypothetical protein
MERVQAERDEWKERAILTHAEDRARLDRAVNALRRLMASLAVDEDGNLTGPLEQWAEAWVSAQTTLSDIEWPDGDEVGQPTC